MEDLNASGSDHGYPSDMVQSRKRRWTTQMMKTWVASDPSRTAPVVEHRDPKAAARAEKKKRRKLEQDTATRGTSTHRVIQAPTKARTVAGEEENNDLFDRELWAFEAKYAEGNGMEVEHGFPTSTLYSWDTEAEDDYYVRRERGQDTRERILRGKYDNRRRMTVEGPAFVGTLSTASWSSPETTPRDLPRGDAGDAENAEGANGFLGRRPMSHADATQIREVSDGEEANITSGGDGPQSARQGDRQKSVVADVEVARTQRSGNKDVGDITTEQADPTDEAYYIETLEPAIADSESTKAMASVGDRRSKEEDTYGEGDSKAVIAGALTDTANIPGERGEDRHEEGYPQQHAVQATNDGLNAEFNSGWRRFGPQGVDISEYVPRFHKAPKIQWPTMLKTVGPYIPAGSQRKGARNKLRWDYTFASTVSKRFKDSRERPDLCVHAKFTNEYDAVRLVRECMAKGLPLVIDDFPDSVRWAASAQTVDDDPFMKTARWSDDEVEGVVGANLSTPRDFQDAGIREEKPLEPYITATLNDFHTWVKKPGVVRCILDLTCGFPQSDDLTNRVADNVVQSVSQTYGNMYSGHYTIPADMMKTQDWFLLHTSGFLTFGHIDGSGMATSAQIRGAGLKEWILFKSTKMPAPKTGDTRRDRERSATMLVERIGDLVLAASNEKLQRPNSDLKTDRDDDSDWDVDGCIIELRPGMKFFQPSGTVHAAYTPVPTAASGKHFFTYDDLHRVEVARRVQLVRRDITNHNHNCGVQLMLISMAAALPMKAAAGRVFYRKPLIALALMLTRPYDYIQEPEPLHEFDSDVDDEATQCERGDEEDDEEEEKRKENKERQAEFDMTTRLRSDSWADDGTAFDRLAYAVATRILNACKTKFPGDRKPQRPGREYIFEGDRWEDPGQVFDARSLTFDMTMTHIDDLPKDDASDETTDSELTDLDDL